MSIGYPRYQANSGKRVTVSVFPTQGIAPKRCRLKHPKIIFATRNSSLAKLGVYLEGPMVPLLYSCFLMGGLIFANSRTVVMELSVVCCSHQRRLILYSVH